NGSVNDNSSTSAALSQVVKYASTTTVTSSSNPSGVNDPVTFTATAHPVSPGTATPTGTVTFRSSLSGHLDTVTLVNGTATDTFVPLNHDVVQVTYNGSAAYLPSTSPTLTQFVK